MNTLQEKAVYQLAGNTIEAVSTSELFKLANEHPYFSAAQYFLSYKLNKENHSGFQPQLRKTALFFNNPNWLQYQLQENTGEQIKLIQRHQAEEETKPLLNRVIEEEIAQQAMVIPMEQKVVEIEPELLVENKKEEPVDNSIQIPTMESARHMMNGTKPDIIEDVLPREIDMQDGIVEHTAPSITSFALEATEDYPYQQATEQENITAQINEEAQAEIEPVQEEQPEKTDGPIIALDPVSNQETVIAMPGTEEENQSIAGIPEEEIVEEEGPAFTPDKINNLLTQQLEEFRKPVDEGTELKIESEPFHTVDYFASQGIKAMQDNISQDKLSKQLRKFTDWLKHMKQAEDSSNDLGTDPELEAAIQSIAKTSNEAKEIVTETMAEVLEKQGKLDKAIQLYIKLSFLNPDKSAYFAMKIQKLKGI
jgi:tetratricopeptide (TPR) repeat protein